MAEIQIEFDVPARVRDGTVLRADVYRPGGTGPWPVLLSRLPYGKQTSMMAMMLDPLAAARRGFMVVIQDTRGRFASEGEWEPWTYEESDGYDTVRWAAALPGSNGSLGMIDGSYFGNTQWMAALSKPPELKAIAFDENGVSRNVTDGIVRVRAATPGEAGEHVVDLWSTGIVFRAGHRIRVQVTSSNFPRWDRDLNTGGPEESDTTARVARQQVSHDPARPSRIVLPVLPVR